MQTYYETIPEALQEKHDKALAKKVLEAALYREDTLAAALDWLRDNRPNAYLTRHPLSTAELQFWTERVQFIRGMLGSGQTPVNDESIEKMPWPYIGLLHEIQGDINAAACTLESPPASFDLTPQAQVRNSFIPVRVSLRKLPMIAMNCVYLNRSLSCDTSTFDTPPKAFTIAERARDYELEEY